MELMRRAVGAMARGMATSSSARSHQAKKVALLGCVGWCWDDADRERHRTLLQDKIGNAGRVEAGVIGRAGESELLQGAAAIVALEFSPSLLDHVSALPVLLQSPGAGTDRIDLASLADLYPSIAVCNAGGHEVAMAEYVMLGMLAHAHDFVEASRSFELDASWRMSGRQGGPLHRELHNATLGVVGMGPTGSEIAKRASAFGMRVLGCNRTLHEGVPGLSAPMFPLDELRAMAAQCDYLVLTVALTPQTTGLIDAATLGSCKRGSFLVNVGRADLCDEGALYEALASGHLGGAMIDVWWRYPTVADPSPRPSHMPFHELPNVIMTPHASMWTHSSLEKRWDGIAANLVAALEGRAPRDLAHVVRRPDQ